MINFLKNHPFSVEAHFDSSMVLTFAVPKEQLEKLIPNCLELDLFEGKWAFIAIAMVQTSGLRPKGFPKFMGNNFYLTGYRIFVRYKNKAGKIMRGLYIIKSETDKKKMEFFGNIFTHYKYTTTDIKVKLEGNTRTLFSSKSKFRLTYEQNDIDDNETVQIPPSSPFTDWKDARKFAGPLPFTFTVNEDDKTILIIEGVRQKWKPKPVSVKNYDFDFLNQLKLEGVVLANAFEIKDIPYYWKKGCMEKWGI